MKLFNSFTKVALVVEYDGSRYHGFQWQANLPTIQDELERAIQKLTGESIRVMAASRTDAGVHAKGQVVSFRTMSTLSPRTLVNGLNYYLPDDIVIKAAYKVSDNFSVRRDAVSREYDYYIVNRPVRSPFTKNFAHFMAKELDVKTMNEACHILRGEHDCISFTTSSGIMKDTIRTIYEAKVEKKEDLVIYHMVANSFLPHQVRNTVGLLIRVGLGKMSAEKFHHIMEAKSPGLAGPTAPACGLCLTRINYPEPFGN